MCNEILLNIKILTSSRLSDEDKQHAIATIFQLNPRGTIALRQLDINRKGENPNPLRM